MRKILCFSLLFTVTDGFGQVDSSRIVRVLSFNILHGSTTQGDFDLEVLADLIMESNADLVAMQEVDYMTNRARQYDLATELGWRTKRAPLFGRAMAYDGGEYGEAVLSRFSFVTTRNHDLPHVPGQEPRAALEVVTLLPSGDSIRFIGTHLAHEGTEGRVLQAKKLNEIARQQDLPTILAGDLNAVPDSEPMQVLDTLWSTTYDMNTPYLTYSSKNPQKKIDYILTDRHHAWKVMRSETICDTVASDHCAYLVTLYLGIKD
ncbi:MAG: endonuclease/exonuclease/phosphatase family protein [Saprospiraceae bacterium]|nr:endonuclease/exonuclease/phosphatase family protein [Saprospiraceae bacterium]